VPALTAQPFTELAEDDCADDVVRKKIMIESGNVRQNNS
jgi:hypothetical protein